MSSWGDSDHTARPRDNTKLTNVTRHGAEGWDLRVLSHPAAKISSLHTRKLELRQSEEFT